MTGLHVLNPGPRTTVQDGGRTGYQHHGLAAGSAADLRAWRWANHMLDNPVNAACLEITLGGFTATAEGTMLMAITGAADPARLNGRPLPGWSVFLMQGGDRLEIPVASSGLLTYLAVVGGWQTRCFLGSRSAVVREQLTGLGAIKTDDRIPALPAEEPYANDLRLRRRLPTSHQPQPGEVRLKLVPGPDQHLFSRADLARLVQSPYQVTADSDRMGYRLDGTPLLSPGGVTSRGVNCGTVQIPGDGKPMVLLNDRQTMGGYPVIGTVPRLDCSRLAQCRPGERVWFCWSDVAECQGERMIFEEQMRTLEWNPEGKLTRHGVLVN